jgi:putative flippase GtrA
MSVAPITQIHPERGPAAPDVDIVVPVYNEAGQLASSITALRSYLDTSFPFVATVTIADNASTDRTWSIATDLVRTLPGVQAIHLDRKGRGRALKAAWSRSQAMVVAYMDVDLATGLDALLPLVAPLLSGHSDMAIGTRLGPGAHVVRGARREVISRCYNLLLRTTLRSACTDAQCGFKALRREAAEQVLPLVEDDEWFFDTEVLVTAQRVGLRIHEVPVDWVDDMDSRVDVVHTAAKDLQGVWRMLGRTSRRLTTGRSAGQVVEPRNHSSTNVSVAPGATAPRRTTEANHRWPADDGDRPTSVALLTRRGASVRSTSTSDTGPVDNGSVDTGSVDIGPVDTGSVDIGPVDTGNEVFADELLRFAGVGALSTVAYAGLFAALEPSLGGYLANAVAIALCSLGNTAIHRGMVGTAGQGLDRRQRMTTAAALMGVSLGFTTGALAVTRAAGFTSLVPELCAVTAGNAAAAFIRFGILRTWVFRPEFGTHLAPASAEPGPRADQHRPAASTRMPS